jgi:glucose-6-phosphate-specific signal transduction histidine kinase
MQTVARWAVRHTAILAVDVLIAAIVIAWSSLWGSPFLPYAVAVLVLPALISGWRGGFLAGVLLSGLLATLHVTVVGAPVFDPAATRGQWLVVYLLPSVVGACLPSLFHLLRRAYAPRYTRAMPLVLPPLTNVSERFRDALPMRRRGGVMTTSGGVSLATRTEAVRVSLYQSLPSELVYAEQVAVLVDRFEQQTMIATRVVFLGRPQPIQPLHLPLLRRVIIESLLNVEQHAQAASVSVLTRYDQRTVTVVVQDDGVGLPTSGIQRAGLHSMHALMYRTSELGGRLEVFNNASSGVAVRLVLPLLAQDIV